MKQFLLLEIIAGALFWGGFISLFLILGLKATLAMFAVFFGTVLQQSIKIAKEQRARDEYKSQS